MMPEARKLDPAVRAEALRHAEAIRRAVHEAVRYHAFLGNPVVGWRDGKIVWHTPEEILSADNGRGETA